MMGSDQELASPLISSSAVPHPRILDREGAFSQSRGRWSVSLGSTRQRRSSAAAAAAANNADSAVLSGVGAPPRPPPDSGGPSCCLGGGNDLRRRCWDDWFHTLSYTPTCILMFGVFVAYFITIVIFAGLYLAVNKVGTYYEHGETHGENYMITGEVDGTSFCGMDINNHMEGE